MTIADLWRNFTDSADIVSFFTFLVLCSYLVALEWSCAIAPSLWWSHIERKYSSRETVFLICIYNSCFVLLGKSLVLSFCCSVHTLLQKKNKRPASGVPLCLGKRENVCRFLSFSVIFAEISVIFCHFLGKSAWHPGCQNSSFSLGLCIYSIKVSVSI